MIPRAVTMPPNLVQLKNGEVGVHVNDMLTWDEICHVEEVGL
jgi:hypothetical protein